MPVTSTPRPVVSVKAGQRESESAHRPGDSLQRTILVAAKQQLRRELLAQHINRHTPHRCVASSAELAEIVATCRTSPPDIVIILSDEDAQGVVRTVQGLREDCPAVEVMVIAISQADTLVRQVLAAGARGFVDGDHGLAAVDLVLHTVTAGQVSVDPATLTEIVRKITRHPGGPVAGGAYHGPLTLRESAVLALLVDGLSTAAITQRLGISEHTTRTHIKHIMGKLGVHSRLAAAAAAVQRDLL